MNNSTSLKEIAKIFFITSELMRLDKPVGYLLCFFPAVFSLLIAFEKLENLLYVPLFFIGSVLVRGAGCIINDFFDKDFDGKVERTKDRLIAKGEVSIREAVLILCLLLSLSLTLLLMLPLISILIGFLAVIMMSIYPLMKRFTYYPQVFLGFTFNLGSLIAYGAVKQEITLEAIIIYVACVFWTVAYDTIYAFADLQDDKKIGVKSLAVKLENKPYRVFILSCYMIFLSLISYVYVVEYDLFTYIACVFIMPVILVSSLDINDRKNCIDRFNANIKIGWLITMFLVVRTLILENAI